MATSDGPSPSKRIKIEHPGHADSRKETELANFELKESGFLDKSASNEELMLNIDIIGEYLEWCLENLSTSLPHDFIADLKATLSESASKECKLGFTGPSGAGKSSSINALLGQPDLLPSGSWGQACTPVPIEVAQNKDEAFAYRAIITYTSEGNLHEDMRHAQQAVRDGIKAKNDALDPLHRVMALIPSFKTDALTKTIDQIINESSVRKLLGTRQEIKEHTRAEFEKKFRPQLTAQKITGRSATQIWPIVEHVRVFVNAPILTNGLVIVDIPGCGDSNKARGGRAKEYISSCTAICIMADGLRVGSDEVFAEHLHEALHQLVVIRGTDRIVMVSTKADSCPANMFKDIDDQKLTNLQARVTKISTKLDHLQEEYEEETRKLKKLQIELDETVKFLRRWKSARTRLNNGAKPKRPISARLSNPSVDEFFTSDEADAECKRLNVRRVNLEEQLQNGQNALASHLRLRLAQGTALLKDVKQQLKRHKVKLIISESKRQLQAVFASKFEAVQQEIQHSAHDDDHVVQNLPLFNEKNAPFFCVSSSKYLKFMGLEKDDSRPETVFDDVDQTGIPALMAHLKKFARRSQRYVLTKVYNEFTTALRSLALELWKGREVRKVDSKEAAMAAFTCQNRLKQSVSSIAEAIQTNRSNVENGYQTIFTSKLATIAKAIEKEIRADMETWIRLKGTNHEGSFWHAQFRSIVKNRGDYSGRKKLDENLNARMERRVNNRLIGQEWATLLLSESSVVRRASLTIREALISQLEQLHIFIRSKCLIAGVRPQSLFNLDQQLKNRVSLVKKDAHELHRSLQDCYIPPSHTMQSEIKQLMEDGYAEASMQRGSGSLAMMLDALQEHFTDAKVIRELLKSQKRDIQKNIVDALNRFDQAIDEMIRGMMRDYDNALADRDENAQITSDPNIGEARSRMIMHGWVNPNLLELDNDKAKDSKVLELIDNEFEAVVDDQDEDAEGEILVESKDEDTSDEQEQDIDDADFGAEDGKMGVKHGADFMNWAKKTDDAHEDTYDGGVTEEED